MIFWIIIGLLVVYYTGFLTSCWFSSDKISQLEKENEELGIKIIEAYNELDDLDTQLMIAKNKLNSYPVYTTYSEKA